MDPRSARALGLLLCAVVALCLLKMCALTLHFGLESYRATERQRAPEGGGK